MKKEYRIKGLYNFYKLQFENKNIEVSDLDWLVCEVLKIKRGEIPLVKEIKKCQFKKIVRLASKRLAGIPVDRLLGKREFYGREFKIGKNVLSPRSETEILCETVIKNNFPASTVLELGTGSGVIGITLKKENENFVVTATDVSKGALKNAKRNANALQADIKFVQSFLFDKLSGEQFDVIVSNPPYIATAELLNLDGEVLNFDPKLALDGGADGMFFYKNIIKFAPLHLKAGGKLFFELGIGQSDLVSKMLENAFCDIQIVKDYSGIDRVIWAKKKEKL